jgi:hypothetical protein
MKKHFLIICIISISQFVFSQTQEATTADGKKVILLSDGTWKLAEIKKDTIYYNQATLLGGCWFFPHQAVLNIAFYENDKFKFNSYYGLEEGVYELLGNDVILTCNNGTKYRFYIFEEQYLKSCAGEKMYYYLVHSKDWIHPNLE